ncbi:hypothetical protein QQF45_17610 [Halopseudomonas aestusnigri]|uniref:hypothetical protein n=1 Tax=Halopseudomonas aestusnigri TaxID=857252 RepID=UPI0025564F22|nr:hypothetical protein [Halopseudomonas aestusnigri]MDL2200861.1 hypothetical protein [Halopseudomonas aestusnigri]
MKTEQQHEEQYAEAATDTTIQNADVLREQVAELESALLAETQAKHEAVECLRRIVDGDESGELVELINGILSKHPEAADGVLAAAPAPVEQEGQEPAAWIRFRSDGCYEGPHRSIDDVRKRSGEWTPLYPASAPVERVEQEADCTLECGAYGSYCRCAAERATPQPAPTACTGKNCGSTDPNLHSAECFAEHEQAIAPTAAQDVAGPTLLELLEKIDSVRMGAEESAHHVHGAAYWNNAVVACLDAVRKAHQSGGAK